MGMGKSGFRLHGSKEVTGLYPGLEKDLLVSLALRQRELFAGRVLPLKPLGKWGKGPALGGEKGQVRPG